MSDQAHDRPTRDGRLKWSKMTVCLPGKGIELEATLVKKCGTTNYT